VRGGEKVISFNMRDGAPGGESKKLAQREGESQGKMEKAIYTEVRIKRETTLRTLRRDKEGEGDAENQANTVQRTS